MSKANKARGEVSATLGDSEFTFCATLGALAEIETALDVDSVSLALLKVSKGSVKAMTAILESSLTDTARVDELRGVVATPQELADVVFQVFNASGMLKDSGEAQEAGNG